MNTFSTGELLAAQDLDRQLARGRDPGHAHQPRRLAVVWRYVGRLAPEKGLEVLGRAWREVLVNGLRRADGDQGFPAAPE